MKAKKDFARIRPEAMKRPEVIEAAKILTAQLPDRFGDIWDEFPLCVAETDGNTAHVYVYRYGAGDQTAEVPASALYATNDAGTPKTEFAVRLGIRRMNGDAVESGGRLVATSRDLFVGPSEAKAVEVEEQAADRLRGESKRRPGIFFDLQVKSLAPMAADPDRLHVRLADGSAFAPNPHMPRP